MGINSTETSSVKQKSIVMATGQKLNTIKRFDNDEALKLFKWQYNYG